MKNNIEKSGGEKNFCSSCQICSSVCPVNAIKIKLDDEGFYKPIIDDKKCIDCGICVSNCYKYDDSIIISDKNLNSYAVKSKSKELLLNSTSGGVSTHLAEELINEGYKIIGVTYNYEKDIAENVIINKVEELKNIQGSKYIQSYSEKVIKELFKNLENGKYAIFGLPCQIYAMDRYLKKIKKRENFLLIDLFCHGCPSLILWKKYLEFIKQKYKLENIKKIEFRSKKKGWHEYVILILDKEEREIMSKKNEQDGFFRLFFSDKILNKSCYECDLRSTLNYTDIRLGDYWGTEYDLDTEGVSAVVLVTKNGEKIFEKIKEKVELKKSSLENIIKTQSYGKKYKLDEKEREKIFKILKENRFQKFLKEYGKIISNKEKIKHILKSIMYLLPQKLRFYLKKYYHSRKEKI